MARTKLSTSSSLRAASTAPDFEPSVVHASDTDEPRTWTASVADDITLHPAEGSQKLVLLTRAHLEHMAVIDQTLADRTADIDARLSIQGQTVADLDRRIAQIDAAIEESTRLGRPVGAMTIADQKRRERADIVAERQRQVPALGSLQIEKAKIEAQRRRAEADVGPLRYLAELMGTPSTDLERPVRLLTLALVAVLDPMAVALLLAAGTLMSRGQRGGVV